MSSNSSKASMTIYGYEQIFTEMKMLAIRKKVKAYIVWQNAAIAYLASEGIIISEKPAENVSEGERLIFNQI